MDFGKETKLLICMLSKGMDVSFPNKIRCKRKIKLYEKSGSVQLIAIHEDRWKEMCIYTVNLV